MKVHSEEKPAVLHNKSAFKSKVMTGVHGASKFSAVIMAYRQKKDILVNASGPVFTQINTGFDHQKNT